MLSFSAWGLIVPPSVNVVPDLLISAWAYLSSPTLCECTCTRLIGIYWPLCGKAKLFLLKLPWPFPPNQWILRGSQRTPREVQVTRAVKHLCQAWDGPFDWLQGYPLDTSYTLQIIDLSIIIQSAHRQMLLNWQETGASETRNIVPTAPIATWLILFGCMVVLRQWMRKMRWDASSGVRVAIDRHHRSPATNTEAGKSLQV